MKTYLMCLANSWKLGGRCLAGIEIKKNKNDFEIVDKNGCPIWIRPILKKRSGINFDLVGHIHIFDIFEIDIIDSCPNGPQIENVFIVEKKLKVLEKFKISKQHINFILSKKALIFNRNKMSVSISEAKDIGYSLMFIKPKNPKFKDCRTVKGYSQLRVDFEYNDIPYNFTVTDPDFVDIYKNNKKDINLSEIYFTISLADEFEKTGHHYKLIAAVVRFKNKK